MISVKVTWIESVYIGIWIPNERFDFGALAVCPSSLSAFSDQPTIVID